MWKRIVERQLRHTYAAFNAGDAEPAIARFAPDAHFRIAGSGPLNADLHGRDEIGRWLRALMQHRLHWEIKDILVNGSPRHTRLVTRYAIHATSTNDPTWNYRGVQYAQLRWGKITLDDILTAPLACSPARQPPNAPAQSAESAARGVHQPASNRRVDPGPRSKPTAFPSGVDGGERLGETSEARRSFI